MRYIFDTNLIVPYLARDMATRALLRPLIADGAAISAVTLMEAWQGLYLLPDPARSELRYRTFLSSLSVLPLDEAVAKRCARLRFDLQRMGKRVRPRALDLMIAATALEHGLVLVTRNRGDFDDIPGLALYQF